MEKLPQQNIFENIRVQEIHKRLYEVPRAGWVKRGVSNPENVGEHTEGMVELLELWKNNLKIQDINTLRTMLRIHDWPEITHGDELTYQLDGDEYKTAKEKKYENEKKALKELCLSLGTIGDEIFNLWLRFEAQQDSDAQLGYQIDKIHAVVKALEYQKKGESVDAMEFANEVRKRDQIKDIFLLEKLTEIETESKLYHK
jgi:putative hydrolases of HD superfamily